MFLPVMVMIVQEPMVGDCFVWSFPDALDRKALSRAGGC